MSYKSRAERERENWITLPEAVIHICSACKCDHRAAHRQLRAALADGVRVLGPLKWERERRDKPPPFGANSIITPTDTPPLGRAWLEAEIDWKTGRVRDDWGEYKRGKRRVLLIDRDMVARRWRQIDAAEPLKKASQSASLVEVSTRRGGRPTQREQVYDELRKMREEGKNMTRPQKALANEVARRANKNIGDRNWNERTIIKHVSKWLHDNGLV